jgi:hypothetical protein
MNRDVNPINQPEGTSRYVNNAIISEQTGLLENIRGEKLVSLIDGNIVGMVMGNEFLYIFASYSSVGRIYRVDIDGDQSVDLILTDSGNILDLQLEGVEKEAPSSGITKYIQLVYQSDFEGHDVFSWAGQYKPKIIDIGKLIEDHGLGLDLATEGYFKKDFLLFPESELFNPEVSLINSGGTMKSGSWSFFYRHIFEDLSESSFSGASSSVFVTEDDIRKGKDFVGDEGNVTTNKAVEIVFEQDLEISKSVRIQVGYISIREGVVYAGLLRPVPRTDKIVFTGEAPFVDLGDDISEIVTPKAQYINVKTLTSLSSRLYAGNTQEKPQVNLQGVANACASTWEAIRIDSESGRGSELNQNTFGYGEIYSLYITGIYKDGSETRGFHIPGRKFAAGDTNSVTPVSGGESYEKFKVFDTCSNAGVPGVPTNEELVCMTGNTGYWANVDEEYPAIGVGEDFESAIDSSGPYLNNVRHHKMPNLKFLMKNDPGAVANPTELNVTTSYRLNIGVNNIDFSVLSQEERDLLVGYNIYYAKRKIGEFVTISEDIPMPCGVDKDLSVDNHFSLAESAFFSDEAHPVATPSVDGLCPSKRMLKLHNLFLLKDNPSISPSFLVTEVGGYISDQIAGYTAPSEEFTNPFIVDGLVTVDYAYNYNYYDVWEDVVTRSAAIPDEDDSFSSIDDFAYVKNGVKYSFDGGLSINNKAGEDALVIVNNGDNGFNVQGGTAKDLVFDPSDAAIIGTKTTGEASRAAGSQSVLSRTTLRGVPGNVASPFPDQELIIASTERADLDSGILSTKLESSFGDKFIGNYHFGTTGPIGKVDDFSEDPVSGKVVIFTTTDEAGIFKGEGSKGAVSGFTSCHINHNAQYSDPNDVQSHLAYLNGAIGVSSFRNDYDQPAVTELNTWYFHEQNIYESFVIKYSSDFHRQSEYFIRGINDGFFIDNNIQETVVAFSQQQKADVAKREWRNWLLLGKYVQPSEKGPIINLKGAGNQKLYIHHEHSLYITKDRVSLKGDQTDVVLGSNDIFSVTPFEIASVDEGHTGIKNRNWASLTPFGYAWINADGGKVYIHNGQDLDEISAKGMRTYFRENTSAISGRNDGMFVVINDDLRKRIIVKIAGSLTTEQVLAYSTETKSWTSFQDLEIKIPIVSRYKKLISIGSGGINEIAAGDYNNSQNPFVIEVVFNENNNSDKYLTFVKWNTNVFDQTDIIQSVDLGAVTEQEMETFNKIRIYSDTKIYGSVDANESNLIPLTGFPPGSANCRRVEGSWFFNSFKDLWDGVTEIYRRDQLRDPANQPNLSSISTTKEWHEKSRMRDKYLIVRLIYDKNNTNKVIMESIDFGSKQSIR